MTTPRIVVCDDERLIRLWCAERLGEAGYAVACVETGAELMATLAEDGAALILLDLRLPDASGIDLLPAIREVAPQVPVIMMSAYGEIQTAVAAVRAGAHHFLQKPIVLDELLLLIDQAWETHHLRAQLDRFREGYRWQFSDVVLVGRSAAVRRIAELVDRIGAQGSKPNLLIRGESGTGKDVVARAFHARGPRHANPFVSINCTSVPEHLVESELFGHEAGAYTDARSAKRGLFEIAHGGTIFLDEIGDMPLAMQGKLLHFLETHQFRRVGGTQTVEVDVHVITATNRLLEEAVAAGQFRDDLYYRLNVLPVVLPPLRERPEDVVPLTGHFLERLAGELRQPVRTVSPEALRALETHAWPGNARELRNTLERILLLEDSDPIQPSHLPFDAGDADRPGSFRLPPSGVDLDALERDLIRQALERTQGNKTQAARLLGMSRDTLRYRLEKYGVGA